MQVFELTYKKKTILTDLAGNALLTETTKIPNPYLRMILTPTEEEDTKSSGSTSLWTLIITAAINVAVTVVL